jgi:hypothetical protein
MESSRVVPEPSFDSLVGLARNVALTGIAGLFTGILVGGIGGRLFMRLAGAAAPEAAQGRGTEAGFTVGEVTVGGTIALVIFVGLFTGIVGAIFFAVFSPWLSWARKWRGAMFGVVLFAIGSATSDIMNPDNIDFRILENPVLLVSAIFLMFVAFGVCIDAVFRFLDHRMPRVEGRNASIWAPYVLIAIVGLLTFIAVFPALFTDSLCDCDPPIVATLAMVLSVIGTLVWWAAALFTRMPAWSRGAAAVLGYAGLLGVLFFGLLRAMSDAIDIIG